MGASLGGSALAACNSECPCWSGYQASCLHMTRTRELPVVGSLCREECECVSKHGFAIANSLQVFANTACTITPTEQAKKTCREMA